MRGIIKQKDSPGYFDRWQDDRNESCDNLMNEPDYIDLSENFQEYNGWSRDDIMEVFGGDPMNTWNVD
jgi:hypothetical protein